MNAGPGVSPPGDKKEDKKKTIAQIIEVIAKITSQVVDTAAKVTVLVAGMPFRFAAAIVAQFVGNGGTGKAAVGGVLFILGSAISADSIWQTVFQQRPIFPWFESGWSFSNALFALYNPFFYVAFLIAVGIQVIEARALRGKNPDSARREFEESKQYELETKPGGKIDLVGVLWQDYKQAGLRDHSTEGYVTMFLWGFDLVTTFAARNPFGFLNPATIVGCLLFNFATMMAGEMGYAIWRLTKD